MLNLVLLPQWVARLYKDTNRNLRDATNTEVLMSTLSSDDVGKYLAINANLGAYLPEEVLSTFNVGLQNFKQDYPDHIQEVVNTTLLEYKIKSKQPTNDRSKVDDMFGPLEEMIRDNKITYEVITLDADTIAIIPSKTSGLSFKDMLEELAIHLKGRVSFSEFAKTPLFRLIVRQL